MNDSIERVLTESDKRDVEGHPSKNDDREAIWAIRPRWSTPYFVLFTLQVVVGFGIATYDGVSSTTPDKWIQAYFDIILRTGQIGIAAAIITFTVIELLSSTMLMSEWIRVNLVEPAKEKQRARIEMRLEEGRAKGLAEGRAEVIAEMKDWDQRRRAAEQRGETFDEPLPYLENGSSNHQN
ncbi:MAG: hypothetical protein F4Y63_00375 [Chloroflexi bacterium]|nr:hypothetical protein [Chloroflexota bacterium]MYK62533.1 hypothetical protein [Chloroflexota bacterium]